MVCFASNATFRNIPNIPNIAINELVSTSPETPLECSHQCMETQYSTITKLRLYQSYVLSTLLYGSECWRTTERHYQAVSIPHQEPQENSKNLLAWRHLQPTATCPCSQDSMKTIIMQICFCLIVSLLPVRVKDNIGRLCSHESLSLLSERCLFLFVMSDVGQLT